MSVRNHNLKYRPLRGGIAIFNPHVYELGTLGFIATSDGTDRWIVSCYHVLCRADGSPFVNGEEIFQPLDDGPDFVVGRLVTGRADAPLDFAAAKIVDGVEAVGEVFGLGRLGAPADPVPGMAVVKSGITTGITEGTIRSVEMDHVAIAVPEGFAPEYELSSGGDSGAVWVEKDTRSPVALHTRGNDTGEELARGVRILKVLEVLGLQIVT